MSKSLIEVFLWVLLTPRQSRERVAQLIFYYSCSRENSCYWGPACIRALDEKTSGPDETIRFNLDCKHKMIKHNGRNMSLYRALPGQLLRVFV